MIILKVDKFYSIYNPFQCSNDMHIRMSFFDRLKFLMFGEECIFRFTDEESIKNGAMTFEAYRKWRAEQMKGGA